MRILSCSLIAALLLAGATVSVRAQDNKDQPDSSRGRARATLPLQPAKLLRFTTDEGTWMSLDVSRDGHNIVFDLLGDLYTLAITGGRATRITSGQAFDAQPRFSPDGKQIVFVSDQSGSDNLWLIDADGSHPRALTKTEHLQFVSPQWTPDGQYIVVSRNAAQFGSQYDLFLYHRNGGTGLKMTGAANTSAAPPPAPGAPPAQQTNYMGAAFGPDARNVYVATRQGAGGYNQTSFGWQVSIFDRETGKTFPRTTEWGSGMRPAVSPDGKWLVYATRADSVTALRLRDLASGDERWLAPKVQRDDQESRFTRDLLPGYAFTPDSRAIVISYGGKLWRVAVPDGAATAIPFSAEVDQMIAGAIKRQYPVDDSLLTVRQIRDARPSPDGKRLAFTALDKLWVMDLPSGTPRRMTATVGLGEHSPVWSPDGRYIAYLTWNEEGGDVWRIAVPAQSATARAAPQRLSTRTAFYDQLNYTPDGTRLVVARGPREARRGLDQLEPHDASAAGVELVWLPATGGDAKVITPVTAYGWPHFGPDSSRLYFFEPADGLVSMRFDGTDRKVVVKVVGANDVRSATPRPEQAKAIILSPDGTRAVAQVANNVYLLDVPTIGQTPTISVANVATAAVPVRRLTRIGGDFAGWTRDGRQIFFSIGRSYFAYDIAAADSLIRDSTARADSLRSRAGAGAPRPDSGGAARVAYEPRRTDVTVTVRRDRPSGTVVLKGARIIPMKGDAVIENGTIVIRDNRIVSVGESAAVATPPGARVIDVAGKTIVPGFVDIHAHMWPAWGVHETQVWEYLANLAYGITTTRDPQTSTTDVLTYGDEVEAGEILGPRVLTTGPGVFSSDNIASLDDARDALRRYTEFYHTNTLKQYMVGDRRVRQWVIMAARELGLMPTLEGGLDFKKNLTEIMDGYSGTEHTYPIAPLYHDVIELIKQSGVTYTPTLLVEYGGPWAENYWYEHYDITKDAKLRHFIPYVDIQRRALRRPGWWLDSQYSFPLMAEQAKKIVEAGGRVGLGGHGQLQGLGAHWELWSIASGGMRPMDVLRVGTIIGAEAIGLEQDLGSLEAGKLADLLVLDRNPLDDIKNTNTIRYVMKNGRLYEGDTLKEIWPRTREMEKPWWVATK
ncbi:MAG: amidohydrolase family protein [Gemmatimonadota bacterium]|nr:amidohydrolase family protein [Gemmatimonadota bacterium]